VDNIQSKSKVYLLLIKKIYLRKPDIYFYEKCLMLMMLNIFFKQDIIKTVQYNNFFYCFVLLFYIFVTIATSCYSCY